MLVPDRRRRLFEALQRTGSAQVADLSEAVGVSASTIRRDLIELEAEGLLRRAHGGAYLEDTAATATSARHERDAADRQAKQRIGRAAVDHLADGMTVMILAGSTTAFMLPHLAQRELTVVTNGLETAHTLAAYPSVTIVMLGGILNRDQMTLLGPMTEQNMADLHVDVLFAGAFGIDADIGVTGAKVIQAGYHRSMLQHADSLVVLADSTKLGRRGPTLLAGIHQVDTFVTDHDADAGIVGALRERGANLTLC
jgi:DeoR/GlpR family transcriptional regulator of sugar metabolism